MITPKFVLAVLCQRILGKDLPVSCLNFIISTLMNLNIFVCREVTPGLQDGYVAKTGDLNIGLYRQTW